MIISMSHYARIRARLADAPDTLGVTRHLANTPHPGVPTFYFIKVLVEGLDPRQNRTAPDLPVCAWLGCGKNVFLPIMQELVSTRRTILNFQYVVEITRRGEGLTTTHALTFKRKALSPLVRTMARNWCALLNESELPPTHGAFSAAGKAG